MATVGVVEVGINVDARMAQEQLDRTSREFDRTAAAAQNAQRKLDGFQKAMVVAGSVVGAATFGFAKFARQSFFAAADVSEMNVAMEASNNALRMVPDTIKRTSLAVRDMGIEMKSAQEIAMIFAQGNLDMSKAAKVARVAQDLAVMSQSNSTETARVLAYAIQTGNSQLLKSAGITRYAGEAYAEFAAELGKSQEALTATERQTAITNMILEEGEKVAGTYEGAMNEAGKVLRSFPRLLNETQVALGSILQQGFGPMIKAAYDLTKNLVKLIQENGALRPAITELQVAFGEMLAPLTEFLKRTTESVKQFNKAEISVGALADQFKAMTPIILTAVTAMSTFAGQEILRSIPIIGEKIAFMFNAAVPAAIAVFVASNEDARAAFLNLVDAVLPAVEAATQVMAELAVAITPVINSLASLIRVATEFESVARLAVIALIAFQVQSKLMASTAVASLVGAITKSISSFTYLTSSIRNANATFGKSTSTIRVWGQATVMSLRAAGAAVKSFLAAALPLAAVTAAVWLAVEAWNAFKAQSERTKKATDDLTSSLKRNTDALLENEAALYNGEKGVDLLAKSLLEIDSDRMKDATRAFGALGVAAEDNILSAAGDFESFAASILRDAGVAEGAIDGMVEAVVRGGGNLSQFYQQLPREIRRGNKELLEMLWNLELIEKAVNDVDPERAFREYADDLIAAGDVTDRQRKAVESLLEVQLAISKVTGEYTEEQLYLQAAIALTDSRITEATGSFDRFAEALAKANQWSQFEPLPLDTSIAGMDALNNTIQENTLKSFELGMQIDSTGMSFFRFESGVNNLKIALGGASINAENFEDALLRNRAAAARLERSIFRLNRPICQAGKIREISIDLPVLGGREIALLL